MTFKTAIKNFFTTWISKSGNSEVLAELERLRQENVNLRRRNNGLRGQLALPAQQIELENGPQLDLLQDQRRQENQGWPAFYDQQREAYIQSLNTQLMDLKQELVQNTKPAQERQMLLLAKDLRKAMVDRQVVQQNFCEAQERLSRLESTLEKIHLVVG
ncbi:centrosomal protein of 55 kDa-like [Takifugu rubripes]|uniref:centrosomal protein of 55 kDa-like n=1 Tax=Takifugu rubripes TaxID=31033 RepID=UPI001145A582|nr:centrosomal protein of 55 kDa-like [Takifugu rubripes]